MTRSPIELFWTAKNRDKRKLDKTFSQTKQKNGILDLKNKDKRKLDQTFSQTKQKNGILDLECADQETRDRWYQQVLEILSAGMDSKLGSPNTSGENL